MTLMGNISPLPEDQLEQQRDLYLARYDNAKYWVDYEDFAFYCMEVLDVYFVGGFGVMGWVSAEEYGLAEPDPLAYEAMMTSVDRLGFHVRLRTGDRVHGARIPFTQEVKSVQETRRVLVQIVQDARQRA